MSDIRFTVNIEGTAHHEWMPYALEKLIQLTPENGSITFTLNPQSYDPEPKENDHG